MSRTLRKTKLAQLLHQAKSRFWGTSRKTLALSEKEALLPQLKKTYAGEAKMEMDQLTAALSSAKSTNRPMRTSLYQLYGKAVKDDTLATQMTLAYHLLQQAPFLLYRADEVEDENATALLKKGWFHDFLLYAFQTEFWGHSLVQILFEDEGALRVSLIPRAHVKPEAGLIVKNTTDSEGLPYRDMPQLNLVEMGAADDLGKLEILTRLAIYKRYADVDWSAYSERFGQPLLSIRTDSHNQNELDALEEFAQHFGSTGYTITRKTDEVEIIAAKQADGSGVFQARYDNLEKRIVQLINGQTSTSEEKAFVGSAEVHERVLNSLARARMIRIQYAINDFLLPLLARQELVSAETKFAFLEISQKENAPRGGLLGESQQEEARQEKEAQQHFVGDCEVLQQKPGFPSKAHEQQLREVFGKKKVLGISRAIVMQNSNYLQEAVRTAYNLDLIAVQFTSPDFDTIFELRRNATVFSAFKNHHERRRIARLLTGAGRARSFDSFRDAALKISRLYNQDWLRTEYNYAVRAAKAAKQWTTIQEGKDLYPNLRYRTVGDDRVRDEHAQLDGRVYPVDDPFWDSYYPPNGWGCRCYTEPTTAKSSPKIKQVRGVPPDFRNNPGKAKRLFVVGQDPYSRSLSKPQQQRITLLGRTLFMRSERKVVRQYAKKLWQGRTFTKAGFGEIRVTGGAIKKMISQPHADLARKNNALYDLETVMDTAAYVGSEGDRKGTHPLVRRFHYFSFALGRRKSYLVVREWPNGTKTMHSIVDKIKRSSGH